MVRIILRLCLSFGFCVVVVTLSMPTAVAQTEPAAKRLATLQATLADTIEIPNEFTQPVPATLIFKYVRDKLSARGKPLRLWIDQAAFKDEYPEAPNYLGEGVVFGKEFLRDRTVSDILKETARQLAPNGVVLRRPEYVEITTRKRASNNVLLLDGMVSLDVREMPLRDAIAEVTAELGLTIQIDPRCEPAMKKPVSVATHQGTTARGLITMWADAFGLVLLADDDRVLLMPRSAYLNKLRDELNEATLLANIARSRRIRADNTAPEVAPMPERQNNLPK